MEEDLERGRSALVKSTAATSERNSSGTVKLKGAEGKKVED